jgi:16S rRNA pseudouridine516 synthase
LPELFASGSLLLEGEAKPCLPAKVEITSPREARIEIIEGRYHQVKRMFASQGCTVTRLHRCGFGDFTVEKLAPGEWRIVTPEETTRAEAATT